VTAVDPAHGLKAAEKAALVDGTPAAWCVCGEGFRGETLIGAYAAVQAHARTAERLRGPWRAVLSDRSGFVYEGVADALANADDPGGEFRVAVVRGSSWPNDRSGRRLRLPGSIQAGDRVFDLEDLLIEDSDDSVSAGARYEQAQAMAAGLNTRWAKMRARAIKVAGS